MKIKTETYTKKYPLTSKAVGGNVDKLSMFSALPLNNVLSREFRGLPVLAILLNSGSPYFFKG